MAAGVSSTGALLEIMTPPHVHQDTRRALRIGSAAFALLCFAVNNHQHFVGFTRSQNGLCDIFSFFYFWLQGLRARGVWDRQLDVDPFHLGNCGHLAVLASPSRISLRGARVRQPDSVDLLDSGAWVHCINSRGLGVYLPAPSPVFPCNGASNPNS